MRKRTLVIAAILAVVTSVAVEASGLDLGALCRARGRWPVPVSIPSHWELIVLPVDVPAAVEFYYLGTKTGVLKAGERVYVEVFFAPGIKRVVLRRHRDCLNPIVRGEYSVKLPLPPVVVKPPQPMPPPPPAEIKVRVEIECPPEAPLPPPPPPPAPLVVCPPINITVAPVPALSNRTSYNPIGQPRVDRWQASGTFAWWKTPRSTTNIDNRVDVDVQVPGQQAPFKPGTGPPTPPNPTDPAVVTPGDPSAPGNPPAPGGPPKPPGYGDHGVVNTPGAPVSPTPGQATRVYRW